MTIFIPKKGTTLYNMYASTQVNEKYYSDEAEGSFLETEGIAVIFYKYPHKRRAYVINLHKNNSVINGTKLPGIKESVDIIYTAQGRKFDLLKRMIYNMEKKYGKKIYTIKDSFWCRAVSLIEKFNGKESAATTENIERLIRPYIENKLYTNRIMETEA